MPLSKATFKGKWYTHIRSFWCKDADSDWQFGKGITLPYDDPDIYDFIIDAMQNVKAALVNGELLPGEE